MEHTEPVVRYRSKTPPIDCPYGTVQRVVTAGTGGIANVHVVRVTEGDAHSHAGYDETYYVLSGCGAITLDGRNARLEPGAVVVIPRGVVHSLRADSGDMLEFVIFGTPPLAADDAGFLPKKPRD